MTDHVSDVILTARERFFERGKLPTGELPLAIMRSWVRCGESGLDAHAAPAIEPLSGDDLTDLLVRHERLRRLARPELDASMSRPATPAPR